VYIGTGMTVDQCIFNAQAAGYTYAGLQYGGECYAGNSTGYTKVADTECNMACTANSLATCGGSWRNSVWQVPTSHPVTKAGGPLVAAHSDCAAAVIAADSYCGTFGWDSLCVSEASRICLSRYVTRPRVESGRVMADTCVEPKLSGYPACPLRGLGSASQECCRRALVLNGVYQVQDPSFTQGKGRRVRRTNFLDVSTPYGTSRIKSTLIPDPCVTRQNGAAGCATPHHLWQAAGPGAPLYPDCSGTGGPVPCNNLIFSDAQIDTGYTDLISPGSYKLPIRYELVTLMSMLITTNGHYEIDARNFSGSSILAPDPDFNAANMEAVWLWRTSQDDGWYFSGLALGQTAVEGVPYCYSDVSPQRTGGTTLINNVSLCDWYPSWRSLESKF
jgi:hypothetical protein